jgi:hypothetical protein
VTRIHLLAGGRRWAVAVSVVVAYASVASFTHPFTDGADLVTALPIAAAAVMVARMRSSWPGPSPARVGEEGSTPNRWWGVWAAVAAAAAGWELYCYTAAPRSEHPTLSSLLDALDASHPGRAAAIALWLALGWYLVRP